MTDRDFWDAALIAAAAAIISKTPLLTVSEGEIGEALRMTADGAADYADAMFATRQERRP